jgi:UTP--glucose-1-phosphate uridylyltransferase
MLNQYNQVQSSIIGCKEVPWSEVEKYGIVQYTEKRGDLYKVQKLVEKPSIEAAPSTQAIIGRYILTPSIFDILEKVAPDKNGEIQLTDALDKLLQKESIHSYNIEGTRYDVGDKFGYLQASIDFALKRPELREKLLVYMKGLI